ncbi:MAG: S41 family peptidase [Muribaculaceae bacterium]|uniref:S41 family peptidase n=1 Tax=Candidatus Limisoma sp. TaxID=3076476 RepID=UPI000B0623F2|nr:S41 family peptidase [Bacteroidales bacterium]MBD9160849.1 S41 family peptidase [Bacteroidales bacterium]MBL6433036.1 S41 family peptidase [Muribaculaceae bacterium]MEE0625792.1 S41 family peptidase [Muribaculaceae bacterium]
MKYLAAAVICAAATFGISAQYSRSNSASRQQQKLLMVENIVNNLYVDNVDEEKIVENAVRGILENLDPHSSYSTKEETTSSQETMQGSFSGIGIQFNMQKDTLYVVQTIAGGPSEKVGILPGDRFIAVDDSIIAGRKLKNTDIMKRLRGPKGTKVNIKVKRGSNAELLEFRITRDDIPLNSIDAVYMADGKTGYIRLSRFAATSYKEFKDAITKLKKQGMQQLILDLTDNGGGYMQIAAQIANEMLNRGNLIVYTQGRKSPRQNLNADGSGTFRTQKVVVMINQFSASASEILSGAVQDWDRGVVVGRRSFGKGLVQREFLLPDSSSFRLTIARYYTPSGRNIQKPYVKGDREDYDKDIIDRYNHGELQSADSIHFADSLKHTTLRLHRTVYGGGGIMPDVFVPLDTTQYTDYHRRLVAKGIIPQFALRYVDKNRADLKAQYPDAQKFIKEFTVTDEMLNNLVDAGKAEKVDFDKSQFAKSKEMLRTFVKAAIANDLFSTGAYFQIVNEQNDIYKEALSIINDDARYRKIISPRTEQTPEKKKKK